MRYSLTMVPTDLGISVSDLARAVEERGFGGVWFPDHSHIPVSRASPYPLGGELPERYRRNLETLTAVTIAAAVTSRIRVGTGVLLPAQRDPIVTGKALATVDQQFGGRVVVGVGYGWNHDEMADHGVDPSTRRGRTREHVLAMRSIWQDDVASFAGRHVNLSPSWSWPKPVQRPLPVLLGGAPSDKVFAQIAEFGQGWIPLGGRDLSGSVARLREQFVEVERDPDSIEIVLFTGYQMDHDKLDAWERAGATEVAFDLPPERSDVVLPMLDQLTAFLAKRAS
jgi:probable F420-dependent oxidoreductase